MSNVSQLKSNINMLSYSVIEKINCFKRKFSESIQASTADFLVKFLTADLSCEVFVQINYSEENVIYY